MVLDPLKTHPKFCHTYGENFAKSDKSPVDNHVRQANAKERPRDSNPRN